MITITAKDKYEIINFVVIFNSFSSVSIFCIPNVPSSSNKDYVIIETKYLLLTLKSLHFVNNLRIISYIEIFSRLIKLKHLL
ncbi:hypothetical protein MPS01_00420 [Marinilactibacillus psychrotolerans]|uniref:Uncharacterized protein n=1 Tax=Marinilactibacillus psychrotolerans TaxID=191770 RepID=A0AAV3WP79_9LACT|nr:hypothetical protein MPS01_00420 [Marinilactibacillus psychrotolerans]GEQ34837.1 hypothetical protein M132T_03450 [Marinilactibacillus psychrotolerans]